MHMICSLFSSPFLYFQMIGFEHLKSTTLYPMFFLFLSFKIRGERAVFSLLSVLNTRIQCMWSVLCSLASFSGYQLLQSFICLWHVIFGCWFQTLNVSRFIFFLLTGSRFLPKCAWSARLCLKICRERFMFCVLPPSSFFKWAQHSIFQKTHVVILCFCSEWIQNFQDRRIMFSLSAGSKSPPTCAWPARLCLKEPVHLLMFCFLASFSFFEWGWYLNTSNQNVGCTMVVLAETSESVNGLKISDPHAYVLRVSVSNNIADILSSVFWLLVLSSREVGF